ncbi:MAG: LCP family protein [Lachnospiraceae bacterium]|jgi:LCP family protein required for cell wall assembly|nr:LCP family protein [Lachnospiraceae bacterium]
MEEEKGVHEAEQHEGKGEPAVKITPAIKLFSRSGKKTRVKRKGAAAVQHRLLVALIALLATGFLLFFICLNVGAFNANNDLIQTSTTSSGNREENSADGKSSEAGTAGQTETAAVSSSQGASSVAAVSGTTAVPASAATSAAAGVSQPDEADIPVTYTNIVLLGVDSRKKKLEKGDNRSDIITIISINNKTKNIKLLSVYRDTYLKTGYSDNSFDKANAAFAYGGGKQAIDMLNTNLDLNITDYITIGFQGVINSINAIGGVDVDIQQDEIDEMNEHMHYMSQQLKITDYPITHPGLQHLNGIQATAYCRVRHTSGNDYKRTDRQRTVMKKVLSKIKEGNLSTLVSVAAGVLPEISTSMSWSEILSLLNNYGEYAIIGSSGVPREDMRYEGYVRGMACVVPKDLASNVKWIHQYLYNDAEYRVPMYLLKISDRISSDTGCWYDDPDTPENEALETQQRVSGITPYTYEAVYGSGEAE